MQPEPAAAGTVVVAAPMDAQPGACSSSSGGLRPCGSGGTLVSRPGRLLASLFAERGVESRGEGKECDGRRGHGWLAHGAPIMAASLPPHTCAAVTTAASMQPSLENWLLPAGRATSCAGGSGGSALLERQGQRQGEVPGRWQGGGGGGGSAAVPALRAKGKEACCCGASSSRGSVGRRGEDMGACQRCRWVAGRGGGGSKGESETERGRKGAR